MLPLRSIFVEVHAGDLPASHAGCAGAGPRGVVVQGQDGEVMLDPEELFELDADRPDLSGAVLLHTLDGFVDAGAAVWLARMTLLGDGAPVVARFDCDQLYDYRA